MIEATRRRWAFTLEYDGTAYVGWQRQANGLSIQEIVEAAASRLANGAPVGCHVAGRTDAGVHAEGQVISLDLPDPGGGAWRPARLRDAINFHLKPHPIVATRAALAPDGFHPRFSAILRAYRYQILNRRPRPALTAGRVWHVEAPLDLDVMTVAAGALLGRHDFTTFRAAACQARNPVRTLEVLTLSRRGDMVVVETQARSFLHHQVRNMVGTLALVGAGRWPADRVGAALEARDRRAGGPTAPASGLCLVQVGYAADPFEGGAPLQTPPGAEPLDPMG